MFRTEIDINLSSYEIEHKNKILILGSCFSNNIGNKLIENKFDVCLNPFGVIYNPISIQQSLDLLLEKKEFSPNDLIQVNGLYHSFYHHGSFSHTDRNEVLNRINSSIAKTGRYLEEADYLIITFGTAYVYEYVKEQRVVSNCHKISANEFSRYRLSIDDIVNRWTKLLASLRKLNPKLKIIFTVSPIRHLREGAHDNQLSKACLLIAIDQLCSKDISNEYFPSYEIMLDDLRDYRFYADDMLHPSALAIDYIWRKFVSAYLNENTLKTMNEWGEIKNAINHKVINPETEAHGNFLKQTLLRLKQFGNKYPYICISGELERLEPQISQKE